MSPLTSFAGDVFWQGVVDGANQMNESLNRAESIRLQREQMEQNKILQEQNNPSLDVKFKSDLYEMCIGDKESTSELKRHCSCFATSLPKKITRAEIFAAKTDAEKEFITTVTTDIHQQCDNKSQ